MLYVCRVLYDAIETGESIAITPDVFVVHAGVQINVKLI